MNIYIYGDNTFKSEVNNNINHSNLRLYLSDESKIEEVNSVERLKTLIEEEPDHIYLIDKDKILDPKSLNTKIGFLKPKGGIEQEFLHEHGVLDSKYESIDDLVKDLKEKFENDGLSKPKSSYEDDEIEDLENSDSLEESDDIDYSFDNSIDYGEIEGLTKDEDDFNDLDLDDYLNESIEKNDIINETNDSNQLEEYLMAENIDNLDNITEEAMLNALTNMDDVDISSLQTTNSAQPASQNNTEISLSGSNANANEIASLISQLLTNKTLEITIKVKS